jgi:hypothetical protein
MCDPRPFLFFSTNVKVRGEQIRKKIRAGMSPPFRHLDVSPLEESKANSTLKRDVGSPLLQQIIREL